MRHFLLALLISLNFLSAPEAVQDSTVQDKQELKLDTAPGLEALDFEEGKLEAYREDAHFDYTEGPTDTWWTRFKSYINLQYHRFLNWLFEDYQANSFIVFLIQLLPYLVLIGVLVLMVWIFNRMNPGAFLLGNQETGDVFFSEEEEIIRSQDIPALISKAIEDKNFRLAIRYYFLMVLQQMSGRGIIDYQFSKTDTDYLSELRQPELQQQFKKLSRIYDYVWYGNFEASLPHFEHSKREMDLMLDLIKKHND